MSAADVVSSSRNPADPAPPPRPAGLGRAAPLLEPTPRASPQSRVNGAVPQRQAQIAEDPMNGKAEGNDETCEKLQMIRVKFLHVAHRLGQSRRLDKNPLISLALSWFLERLE
ncbi:hypothetical protein HHK36_028140 [Tetracentron sinense]|uniref:Uncharacterized protein n=1 Tax=Tetracentron sinense TaxID=13715 RepID=A0A835D275_TETSI|nr:hypothetical protein HHK36_028140 [Tetracentron sinense]